MNKLTDTRRVELIGGPCDGEMTEISKLNGMYPVKIRREIDNCVHHYQGYIYSDGGIDFRYLGQTKPGEPNL